MDKKTALNHLIQTRDSLRSFLEEAYPSKFSDLALEGSWTAQDILGHITAWEITLIKPLNKLLSEGTFVPDEIPDGELYNRQQVKIRRALSLSEIIEEMVQVRQEILKLCDQLPDDLFERTYPAPWGGAGTLADMLYGLAWHENEHLESIHKMKAKITL